MTLELQHVSIPMPADGHDAARAFYGGLLGLEERDVPAKLDPSELIWFRVGDELELHLFDSGDSPPHSQHFCLRVDSGLDELRAKLEDAGSRCATRRRSSAGRASCVATRSGIVSS